MTPERRNRPRTSKKPYEITELEKMILRLMSHLRWVFQQILDRKYLTAQPNSVLEAPMATRAQLSANLVATTTALSEAWTEYVKQENAAAMAATNPLPTVPPESLPYERTGTVETESASEMPGSDLQHEEVTVADDLETEPPGVDEREPVPPEAEAEFFLIDPDQ